MKVYTGGTFDIPHLGHVNFLRLCKKFFPDSYLIVALNTDEFVETYKGFKPFFTYAERDRLLRLVEYVDEVVPNHGGADSRLTILDQKPDVIVIGNDWLQRDYCKQMGFDAQWLTDHGIALCFIPHTDGVSATEIKKRLKNE